MRIQAISAALLSASLGCATFLIRFEEHLFTLAFAVGLLLFTALTLSRPVSNPPKKAICELTLPAGPLAWLVIAHFAWLFMATRFSTVPWTSEWFAWILGLSPLAYLVGCLISPGILWWVGLLIWPLFLATWATVQFLQGADRASGPFADFNAFGAVLYLFAIPLAAALCDPRRSRKQLLLGYAALGLCCLALFATKSRGATIVLLLFGAAGLWASRRAFGDIRMRAGLVAAVVLAAYAVAKIAPASMTFRTANLSHDPSMQYRYMMWRSAWTAWLDHPWLGTGLGTYRLQYMHYRLPTEIGTSGDLAHNDYLQLLMEGGPITLLFLIAWGIAALWVAGRLLRQLKKKQGVEKQSETAFACALILSVLGLFLHAGVNFIFYVAPLSLLSGLYLARATAVAYPGAITRVVRLPIGRTFAIGAWSFGSLLIVASLLFDWSASLILGTARPEFAWLQRFSAISAPAMERYRIANLIAAIKPSNVPAQRELTLATAELAHRANEGSAARSLWARESLEYAKVWLKVSQGNPFVYQVAGQLLWQYPFLIQYAAPLPADPEACLRTAIDRYHAHPLNYILLSAYLQEQGRPLDALRVLHSALPWIGVAVANEEILENWLQLANEGRALGQKLASETPSVEVTRMSLDFQNLRLISDVKTEPAP